MGKEYVKALGGRPAFRNAHTCSPCRTSPGAPEAPDSPPGTATSRAPGQYLSSGMGRPGSCCCLPQPLAVAHHILLCLQEPGFAEVLPSLTEQEMDWLVLGELQVALEGAGGPELRISGYITARQSCDGEARWGLALWVRTTQRHKRVNG